MAKRKKLTSRSWAREILAVANDTARKPGRLIKRPTGHTDSQLFDRLFEADGDLYRVLTRNQNKRWGRQRMFDVKLVRRFNSSGNTIVTIGIEVIRQGLGTQLVKQYEAALKVKSWAPDSYTRPEDAALLGIEFIIGRDRYKILGVPNILDPDRFTARLVANSFASHINVTREDIRKGIAELKRPTQQTTKARRKELVQLLGPASQLMVMNAFGRGGFSPPCVGSPQALVQRAMELQALIDDATK